MGSWNATCMISNLPILSGEKVKMVFLTNYHKPKILNSSGICYPYDLLTPAFLPISGEYDDYGCIENVIEDFNYDIIISYLQKKFPSKIKTDMEEFDVWDLDTIIKCIRRGDCKFLNTYNEWEDFNFSYVFIRDDIYNSVIDIMSKEKVLDFNKGCRRNIIEKINEDFYNDIEYYKSQVGIYDGLSQDEIIIKKMKEDFDVFNSQKYFRKDHGKSRFLTYVHYELYMKKYMNDTVKLNDILELSRCFLLIEKFLQLSRKFWMITSGCGSQDSNWELMKSFSEKIIEICDKKVSEYDEDYVWDEDEE